MERKLLGLGKKSNLLYLNNQQLGLAVREFPDVVWLPELEVNRIREELKALDSWQVLQTGEVLKAIQNEAKLIATQLEGKGNVTGRDVGRQAHHHLSGLHCTVLQ